MDYLLHQLIDGLITASINWWITYCTMNYWITYCAIFNGLLTAQWIDGSYYTINWWTTYYNNELMDYLLHIELMDYLLHNSLMQLLTTQ